MKNNIKYAGIAAAALLTVAPIAAPIVNSNVQTAQAATSDADLTTAQQASLDKVFSNISSTSFTNSSDDAFPSFDDIEQNLENTSLSYNTLVGFAAIKGALTNNILRQDETNLKDANVTFGVEGIGSNGTALNAQDFSRTVESATNNGGSVDLKITAYDANGDALQDKTITLTNSNEDTTVSSLKVNYTDPLDVDLDSSTTTPKLSTSVDATVTDQNGNDVKITNVNPSQYIYTDADDAMKVSANNQYTGATFNQANQTYYQAVNITLDDSVDVQSIYDNFQNGKNGVTFTINGQNVRATNLYAQDGTNVLRFVREINVTDEDSWTETDAPGVVTVNSAIGHLYDDDNNLTSRSLATDTAWQTDKYRTNDKTGQVQYHVSTHEWVNAEDVTFADSSSTDSNALGNIEDLTGSHVVNLAGPEGFVYTLFNGNGNTANRGLAGNSAWVTDKKATDANGNTYYRVSTDEWVRLGTGVTFN